MKKTKDGTRRETGTPATHGSEKPRAHGVVPLRPEELLDTLMETSPAFIYFKDTEGRFLRINQVLATLYGLKDPADAVGKTDADFYPKEDAARFHRDEQKVIRTGRPIVAKEERGRYPDGRIVWNSTTKMPIRARNGRIVGTFGISHDITALKAAEGALAEQAALFTTLMDNIPDAIYFKDTKSRFIRFSRGGALRHGLADPAAAVGRTDFDLFTPEHAEPAFRDEQAVMRTGEPIVAKEEKETFPDGRVRWVSTTKLPLRDRDGSIIGTCGISRDITDLKQAEERLAYQAFYDTLSGLPNRALFADRLEHLFKRAHRAGSPPFAVLYLDLDRFKGVNDSLGHHAGDQMLLAIAKRLETCMRPGDTVARLGGDEFTVLLEEIRDTSDAIRVAERVQSAVAAPIDLGGVEVFTTVSIGIAVGAGAYAKPEEVLRDADTAMYRAKALGKGRYEIFDAAMHERAVTLLRTESELRRALERNELAVYYLPLVTVADGRVLGFEALVRWRHPQRGLLAPAEFLALAEETGLIVPIGCAVLREACRRTAEWQRRYPATPPLRVSVNLSSRQLLHKEFPETLRQILTETGLNPASLTLDVTENTILDNVCAVATTLSQLRALSVQLHIDDFGTGYSSLGQFREMRVDTLKMDKTFVQAMQKNSEQAEIVRTIVTLAQKIGLNVMAEGVETAEQLADVRGLKCASAQGFYFSEPLDADAAERCLAKGPPWKT